MILAFGIWIILLYESEKEKLLDRLYWAALPPYIGDQFKTLWLFLIVPKSTIQ